jgi:ESCRT-II complex subunit VPS22
MRRHGLGAIQRQQQKNALYKEKSEELSREQIKRLTEQIEQFRANLEQFALKHKKEIRRDGDFRRRFQEMCAYIGVDPLQSSNSFWSKLLGVGDFYYELGVQLIEICMVSASSTGGLMRLGELTARVKAARTVAGRSSGTSVDVTSDDVLRALSKLHVLGGGLQVLRNGSRIDDYVIQSVARELNADDQSVLQLAQSNQGWFDRSLLTSRLSWADQRVTQFIHHMIMDGLVWVDHQSTPSSYWFPGLR